MRNARDAHPGCAREGLERDYIGVAAGVKEERRHRSLCENAFACMRRSVLVKIREMPKIQRRRAFPSRTSRSSLSLRTYSRICSDRRTTAVRVPRRPPIFSNICDDLGRSGMAIPHALLKPMRKSTSMTWMASILVQGGHGIHAGGAARGDVGGQQRYDQNADGDEEVEAGLAQVEAVKDGVEDFW